MSLKKLRSKISGVKSTRKITEAMKMVAASKVRRSQHAYQSARPYADLMQSMVEDVLEASVGQDLGDSRLWGEGGEGRKYLIIVIGSQKGLAGAFNVNVVKELRARIDELKHQGAEYKILPVGQKLATVAESYFKGSVLDGMPIVEAWEGQYELAQDIGRQVVVEIEKGEYDRCILVSNRFVNALVQTPTFFSLVPPNKSAEDKADADKAGLASGIEFEPNEQDWLDNLLPRNLETQIFLALLESALGEQAARAAAMDGASRNAGKMIDSLTLRYNRSRQAKITQELSELVAGATAVGV